MMNETAVKQPPAATAMATDNGNKAVYPILKKETDTHHQHMSTSSTSTTSPAAKHDRDGKEKKHLQWDEHAIQEHDLLRGTRMKVRSVVV